MTRTSSRVDSVSVEYSTTDGTAQSGADYVAAQGVLNFPANQYSADINITILDDDLTDDGEFFTVDLSNPTNGAVLGTPTSVQVNITESKAVLDLEDSAVNFSELDGAITLSVLRTGDASEAVSVDYAVVGGTATAGSDYNASNGTLNWAAGDSAPKLIPLEIINDTYYEPAPDETLQVSISNPSSGAILGSNTTADVSITSEDVAPAVSFVTDAISVNEDAGTVAITVVRTGGTLDGGLVTADFNTTNGTATSPSDYAAVAGVLTWAGDDLESQQINVSIVNDADAESPDETFSVVLSGASVGENSAITVTIRGNGAADDGSSSILRILIPVLLDQQGSSE